ncbi:S41 family peptidase [Paenibacillus methanolicus]|uniref:Carboxyl-terminal processing protease n=1 Tax=Paenibacillus methanolicus TaxID=582686 RepID=A0A5S5CKX0_9BACL|nr:S41 family peptidase [Paenibacillus methanolicus]TYP79191.1 carboxyl-terminal processing protease [Paenibacillus methanolicus]
MTTIWGLIDSVKWLTSYQAAIIWFCLLTLGVNAFSIRSRWRVLDFVPLGGLIAALLGYASGDATLPSLVLYGLTLILFLGTMRRLWKRPDTIALAAAREKKRRVWTVLRMLGVLCGVLPILLVLAVAGEMRYNAETDFSRMTYSDAFKRMHERLEREYPFGEWKGIDWETMQAEYESRFAEADRLKDSKRYYLALRDYLHEFRDGHIEIENDELFENNAVFREEAGGGFGLSALRLDDGSVRVSLLLKDGEAERAGIRLGAELLRWNGENAEDVYARASWADIPPSTSDVERENQGRFMVRASIGQTIEVEYRNEGGSKSRTVTLTAYDDEYETLKQTRKKLTPADLEKPSIEWRMLDNGYGYVKVKVFLATDRYPKPLKLLEQAIQSFSEEDAKGVILDLRNNPGGEDELAASVAGYFADSPMHYEQVSYYNRFTSSFALNRMETIHVEPADARYDGKLAVLINGRTASSAEGVPMALKGQANVRIVGFSSTSGSFGVMSSPIRIFMPGGYELIFPDGRSLNEQGMIQLESTGDGNGGVAPDVRIPLNAETFAEAYVHGRDMELDAAVQALDALDVLNAP